MRRFLQRGLLGLIGLFAVGAILVVWNLTLIENEVTHMDEIGRPIMRDALKLGATISDSQAELYRYRSGHTNYIDDIIRSIEQLDWLAAKLQKHSTEVPSLHYLTARFQTELEQYKQRVSEAVTALGPDESQPLADNAFQLGLQIQEIATHIEGSVDTHIGEDNVHILSSVRRSSLLIVLFLLLAIGLAFVVGQWIFRRTMEPITSLAEATQAVARGDLRQSVSWTRDDEVGQLVQSFNDMLKHLHLSQQTLEERNQQLRSLHEIGAALKSATDLEEVLQFALRGVTQGLGFSSAQLYLLDREDGRLRLNLWTDQAQPHGKQESDLPINADHPLIHALQSSEFIRIDAVDTDDWLSPLGKCCLIVPLVGRKEWRCWEKHACQQDECPAYLSRDLHCWMLGAKPCDHAHDSSNVRDLGRCITCDVFSMVGVLAVGCDHLEKPLDDQRGTTLQAFADQAGLAVETAQLYKRLERFNLELETQVEAAAKHLMETREQLYQSEKLAAIGRLAAGVAHEINNPLAAISTYAQSLLIDATGPTSQKELESIRREVRRASEITKDLLQFARPQAQANEPFDVHRAITDAIDFARYHTDCKYLDISTTLEAKSHTAEGNPRQIEEVLLNIFLNAVQAMEGKGRLVVTTQNSGDASELIEIQVSDTGPGMSETTQRQVFEPFYTTKEVGKGTGLGLYLSYWIVERHGGTLEVKSTVGQGATFVVRLPLMKLHPLEAPHE